MADPQNRVSLDAVDGLIARFDETAVEMKEALKSGQIALTKEREKTTALKADKEQATALEAQLRHDLEQAQQRNQDLTKQVDALKNEREEQDEALAHAQQARDTLQQELEVTKRKVAALESDNQVIAQERDKAEKRIGEIKTECQWDLVKALSPVLTKLSALVDLEPEPVKGLTPRSVFEKMKQWVEETTGEHLRAFPAPREVSNGLLLDPDQEGWDALITRYDWSPERPFEGLPEGERSREFRVLQRGWRANDRILIRARVTPVKANDEGR